MMPQTHPEPVKTEWRAEPHETVVHDTDHWFVTEYKTGTEIVVRYIADSLDEPTARLIAAAPERDRLCEELADALTGDEVPDLQRISWLDALVSSIEDGTFNKDRTEDLDAFATMMGEVRDLITKARSALTKAGAIK